MGIYQEIQDPVLRGQFQIVASELDQLTRAIISFERKLDTLVKKRIEELRGY